MYMKKSILFALLTTVALGAVSCSSSKDTIADEDDIVIMKNYTNEEKINGMNRSTGVPLWVTNFPVDDDNYLYEVSEWRGMNTTIGKQEARRQARLQMSLKLETKVQAIQKAWNETVTSADRQNFDATFSSVSKEVTDNTLNLTQIRATHCDDIPMEERSEAGNVSKICFAVAQLPIGDARSAFDNALSRDEELYVKFKASKAFEEFEKQFPNKEN